MKHDVVVIGGGPGGAVTAARLAQLGRRVVVLEKTRFPRFHLGESLLPYSTPLLEQLGVLDALFARFMVKRGARFVDVLGGKSARFGFDRGFGNAPPPAFQVPRDEFDELLLRRAQELGADVREEWTVARVLFEGERAVGVLASDPDGREHEIHASVVVDATGRDALLARARGGGGVDKLGLDKTAFFAHYRGGFRDVGDHVGDIQIVVWNDGWLWVIPFRDGRTSVGAVVSHAWLKTRRPGESTEGIFQRALEESGTRERFLEGAVQLFPAEAAADFSFTVRDVVGDGWLAVGDASGFLDPLFSTGAHLAIHGGFRGAEAIDRALTAGDTSASRFRAWADELRAGADLFLGSVQAFYDGSLSEYLFAEKQHPFLTNAITSMLTGNVFRPEARWAQEMRARFPARWPEARAARAKDPSPIAH